MDYQQQLLDDLNARWPDQKIGAFARAKYLGAFVHLGEAPAVAAVGALVADTARTQMPTPADIAAIADGTAVQSPAAEAAAPKRARDDTDVTHPVTQLGVVDRYRQHAAQKKAHAAEQAAADESARWEALRDAYRENIDVAKTFAGTRQADGVLLKKGEAVYAEVSNCALVEDRRGAGEWTGRSQGFSIPVATIGGRTIRYRVGASKGHYQQGELTPTAVDAGTLYVTDQRVMFIGAKQTRECLFTKMLGFHLADDGTLTVSVSNRQAATTVVVGAGPRDAVAFRLDLALAHYNGTVDDFVTGLESDLAAIEAHGPGEVDPEPAQ